MKKKIWAVLIVIILLAAGMTGIWYVKEKESKVQEQEFIVGNGLSMEEKRNLGDSYSSIDASNVNIIIKPIDVPTVKIIADSNLLNYIITEVRENTLYIYSKSPIQASYGITVEISRKSLEKINFKGEGNLKSEGVLSGKDITVNFDGKGNLDLGIEADNLKLISKIGNEQCVTHTIQGKCTNLVAFVEGRVNLDAANLKIKGAQVAIKADGRIGTVIINPEELLEVDSRNIIQMNGDKGFSIVPMQVKLL